MCLQRNLAIKKCVLELTNTHFIENILTISSFYSAIYSTTSKPKPESEWYLV